MKCPYREFSDCIVEQCPACVYKEITEDCIEGRVPYNISIDEAIKMGYAWKSKRLIRRFVSCSLVDNNVQPLPANKQVINNTTETKVVVSKRSLF